MLIARTLDQLREGTATLRARGRPLALVPTMGALHDGHLSLVAQAARAGTPVASIFVNPTQFGPGEDFARYPRDEAADLRKLAEAGCALAWVPDLDTMYPAGEATFIDIAGPALGWEGERRPGHFRGVATVVAKLFGQVRPDIAIFGEKDWQQLQVVRRMVRDLLLPVQIVGGPVVREADGLAMSSRNRFLTESERKTASRLHAALIAAADALRSGQAAPDALAGARASLGAPFTIDYLDLVDGQSLKRIPSVRPDARLIAAARLGNVRLLDNIAAPLPQA